MESLKFSLLSRPLRTSHSSTYESMAIADFRFRSILRNCTALMAQHDELSLCVDREKISLPKKIFFFLHPFVACSGFGYFNKCIALRPLPFTQKKWIFSTFFFANLKKLKQKLKIYVQKLHQLLGLIVATILRNGSFQT